MMELLNLNPEKPWLKDNGTKLTPDEIKIVSRFWTPENWNEYLESLEFEEDSRIVALKGDKALEAAPYGELKDLLPDSSNLSDELLELIRLALSSHYLSDREREILQQVYWEGKSESEIAQAFKISISNFRKIKIKARVKLKRVLEAYLARALREECANRGIENTYKDKDGV
jgi:RNA polymerase sigma factor (sigma-70 family)